LTISFVLLFMSKEWKKHKKAKIVTFLVRT